MRRMISHVRKKAVFGIAGAALVGACLLGNQAAAQTVFSEDFEGSTSSWGTTKFYGSGNNYWTIDNTSCSYGGNSLQVRKNGGSGKCVYRNNKSHDIMAHIQIDATTYSNMQLEFDWMCVGEAGYDYGSVWYSLDGLSWTRLTDGGDGYGYYEDQYSFTTTTVSLPSAIDNSTFYLGFNWINDGSIGGYPGFIVDDITITAGGSGPVSSIDTLTWDGSSSTAWNTASNWDDNRVPTLNDVVIIPSGLSNQPVINASTSAECLDLVVENGASLEVATMIDDGGSFHIFGSVYVDGSYLHTSNVLTYLMGSGTIAGNFYHDDENASWYIYDTANYTLRGDFYTHQIDIDSSATLDMNGHDL